uniref:Uncharacterized protein n=1 Tax=Rhizophora mucronata TaxID=61149 RepID=A0A2P2NNC0_RHIMU
MLARRAEPAEYAKVISNEMSNFW